MPSCRVWTTFNPSSQNPLSLTLGKEAGDFHEYLLHRPQAEIHNGIICSPSQQQKDKQQKHQLNLQKISEYFI